MAPLRLMVSPSASLWGWKTSMVDKNVVAVVLLAGSLLLFLAHRGFQAFLIRGFAIPIPLVVAVAIIFAGWWIVWEAAR